MVSIASGFMITIAHQSIGDLDAIDTAYTTQIDQNTNTKIFLQSNDPRTLESFSKSLGTRTGVEETQQVGPGGIKTGEGTYTAGDKDKLGPQIVRELQDFEAADKYQTINGKLVLHPLFIKTEGISLPIINKPQGTQEIKQGEGLKESPEAHKSVF